MENQETLTDICEELRSGEYAPLADRIEAAHKRESGDCAKMREALEATLELFWDIHNANRSPQSNQAYAVIRQIKAALVATEKEGGAK